MTSFAVSPRSLRVTDPNFDTQGYKEQFGSKTNFHVEVHYSPMANQIDLAQRQMSEKPVPTYAERDNVAKTDPGRFWNPWWASLSLVGLVGPLHRAVLKNDSPNFVHPVFRRIAAPVALTVAASSAINAYTLTREAQFDHRTARYQAAANLTWQTLSNFVLPATILYALSRPVALHFAGNSPSRLAAIGVDPSNIASAIHPRRVYGAGAIALVTALAVSSYTKDKIEGWFMRRRFSRKDYGSQGHSYELTSFDGDTHTDAIEQAWNTQGNEHVINNHNERLYAEVFPYFSLAEALPTHEVPFHSAEYQNHNSIPYNAALLQGTLDLTSKRVVPTPSAHTFLRSDTMFGEWSLASPYQIGLDKHFLTTEDGKESFSMFVKMHVGFQDKKKSV
jgi:hypothetical protein